MNYSKRLENFFNQLQNELRGELRIRKERKYDYIERSNRRGWTTIVAIAKSEDATVLAYNGSVGDFFDVNGGRPQRGTAGSIMREDEMQLAGIGIRGVWNYGYEKNSRIHRRNRLGENV